MIQGIIWAIVSFLLMIFLFVWAVAAIIRVPLEQAKLEAEREAEEHPDW